MSYRQSKKAKKLWGERANAAKARNRLAEDLDPRPLLEDDFIKIEITRKATNEHAVFELMPGNRCDNYRVYCNNRLLGTMGITKVCEGIRKALPRFMSESRIYS